MTNATAIGYYNLSSVMPNPADVIRAYGILDGIVRRLELEPTYFAASDGKSRTQWKKYGGAFHRKVLDCGANGYRSVGLAVNPAGSKAPGHDSFLDMSFAFAPEAEQTIVEVVIHEAHLAFGSAACDTLIEELARLWSWDYGFGLERDVKKMPGIYLAGAGSRTETEEESRRLSLWYSAYRPKERRARIRDVFPYNMVGSGHLTHMLTDGRSLRDFIFADADSALRPLTDDLWLWTVKKDRTEAVRGKLRGAEIVITE